MSALFENLSGGVPGGLILLIFLLISGNLLLRLLKSSKLISGKRCFNFQIRYSMIILVLYAMLWFALRPPLPPERIVILPLQPDSDELALSGRELHLPEYVQHMALGRLRSKYLLHRWEWMMETLGPDSMYSYKSWLRLANKLDAGLIIESRERNGTVSISLTQIADDERDTATFTIAGMNELPDFFAWFDEEFSVIKADKREPGRISEHYISSKILLYQKRYDQVIAELSDDPDTLSQILLARAFMLKGLTQKIDRVKAEYVKIENKDFNAARRLINPILRQNPDAMGTAYIIGRMALREGEYDKADIYLKKAFLDDPSDCRIHYALSFLLPERLQDIGYAGPTEILERAVSLDPGYRDAVHELAEEYYNTGTGTPSGTGTSNALRTIEHFFQLNSDEPRILSLLGSVYLRISKPDKALDIFTKLQKRYPNDSDAYYNLGIVYYQKNELPKALDYFLQAIELDKNLDSYLYAGVIYREMGQHEKALEYFRERVRRMTGEDDRFARDAMLGIRKTLKDLGQDSPDED